MSVRGWLDGPEAKLDRAIRHLETLDRECDHFLRTKPFSVSTAFEPDADCHVARFRSRKRMPIAVGVIVGEFIHNLRSALEHVAWVLAASNTDDLAKLWETRNEVTFPVAKASEAFDRHSLMRFITPQARAALDPLQPHTRGSEHLAERHPLCALHDFWNVDKHRVVHTGVGAIDLSTTTFVPMGLEVHVLGEGVDVENIEVEGLLADGTPIARISFRAPHTPGTTKVAVKGQPTAQAMFKARDRAATIGGLATFTEYVSDVLTAVRPVFPDR